METKLSSGQFRTSDYSLPPSPSLSLPLAPKIDSTSAKWSGRVAMVLVVKALNCTLRCVRPSVETVLSSSSSSRHLSGPFAPAAHFTKLSSLLSSALNRTFQWTATVVVDEKEEKHAYLPVKCISGLSFIYLIDRPQPRPTINGQIDHQTRTGWCSNRLPVGTDLTDAPGNCWNIRRHVTYSCPLNTSELCLSLPACRPCHVLFAQL